MTRLLVIGGSDAGISAALRARELDPGAEVTVLVADRYPNYSICGIPYFLSGEVASAERLAHRTAADLEATGVRLLLEHRATRVDPVARRVDVLAPGNATLALDYDRLVIGTGADSVRPPLQGLDLPGVFTLRWMADSLAVDEWLRRERSRSAVIIGAGYIGMEMAEALTRRGMRVTVVEVLPQVFSTLDPELGGRVAANLRSHGVEVVTGMRVAGITQAQGRLVVAGDAHFSRDCDLVLVVAGARPASALTATAGLELGPQGAIRVNRRMETGVEGIYAAGDCVETWHRLAQAYTYLPLGTTAHKQGLIAGENALGGNREFAGSLGTQSVKIFDQVAARTGWHDADARAAGHRPLSVDAEVWDHKAYYPGAQKMLIRITGDVETGQLLGAQIVGGYGSEVSKRIDIFAAALFQGLSVRDLEDLDLSYTPPLASPWDPVQMAAQSWLRAWEAPRREYRGRQ
jgi:NADPH-dependent 2,4-dienoyl-CoA reductase/sulfur reductase-like enzyme